MNASEKIDFIQGLTASIASELIDKVNAGSIPEGWDGHELRQLLADKFAFETTRIFGNKRSGRVRNYHNTVIVNNL